MRDLPDVARVAGGKSTMVRSHAGLDALLVMPANASRTHGE
jgi:hypothetical protein